MKKYVCQYCTRRYDEPYCPICKTEIIPENFINVMSDKNKKILTVIVMSVIIILAIIGISTPSYSNSNHNDIGYSTYSTAKSYVENRLKSPKSADFPSYSTRFVSHSGNQYTVSAYVNAENSFGANVRSYFTVTMTRNGDNWENINVTFQTKDKKSNSPSTSKTSYIAKNATH